MTRLAEVNVETLSDKMRSHYENSSPRDKMFFTPTGHSPELMGALHTFSDVLHERGKLPGRLIELIRLRIAFHNQCRSCMAMRYQSGVEDGLTEGTVCSLENPKEASDLTDAEKAALAYADISATNHFDIDEENFRELRNYFSEPEIIELGLYIAYFIGFGRLVASWDMVEELSDDIQDKSSKVTPWNIESFVVSN